MQYIKFYKPNGTWERRDIMYGYKSCICFAVGCDYAVVFVCLREKTNNLHESYIRLHDHGAWSCLPCHEYNDVDTDTSRIVTHLVRRYFHGRHVQYTILACADYRTPYKIFCDLEISRPHDIEFPSSPCKDIRIFKQLITNFPIPEHAYSNAENKLRKKIDDTKIKTLQQRRVELMERNRREIMAKNYMEVLTKKANKYINDKINAQCNTNIIDNQAAFDNVAEVEVVQEINMKNAASDDVYDDVYDDDDDDDDYTGGVIGIYARSD